MGARWLAVTAVLAVGGVGGALPRGADAGPTLAVILPDVSGLNRDEAEALIARLAEVNVITSNCPGWTVDDRTWALITGTGDKLAAQLGLDPATYDATYFGPAFALLDDPGACDRIGPQALPLIDRLTAMGGSTSEAGDTRSAGRGGEAVDGSGGGVGSAGGTEAGGVAGGNAEAGN